VLRDSVWIETITNLGTEVSIVTDVVKGKLSDGLRFGVWIQGFKLQFGEFVPFCQIQF